MALGRRSVLGLGAAAVLLVLGGLVAPSAEARGGNPFVRALVVLARHVERGFAAVGDRLEAVERSQTIGLANQEVLRGEMLDGFDRLEDLILDGGVPVLEPDLVLTTDSLRRGFQNCRLRDGALLFDVENAGLLPAAPTLFSLIAFPPGAPMFRFEALVPGLSPGDVYEIAVPEVNFCDTSNPSNRFCDDFIAWADVQDVVDESDEANNLRETLFAADGESGSTCLLPIF